MNITELIKKVLAGETLTDADKAELKAWKPEDTSTKDAEIAELKAKLALETSAKDKSADSLKSMQAQLDSLTKAIGEEKAAREKAAAEAAAMRRSQAIDGIRAKAGINFIDGIDAALTRSAFEGAFKGVENLEDEAAVKAAVEAFRKANGGLIRASQGGGNIPVGGGGNPGNPGDSDSQNSIVKKLTEAGILRAAAK